MCYIESTDWEKTMSKTDAVRARIDPSVKAEAERILSRHGLSHSTFISMAYHAVVNQGTVPLSFNIPNDALAADLRAADQAHAAGELKSYKSASEAFDDILASSDA
jgi:addiction module RelB/DinJ family antitoxin